MTSNIDFFKDYDISKNQFIIDPIHSNEPLSNKGLPIFLPLTGKVQEAQFRDRKLHSDFHISSNQYLPSSSIPKLEPEQRSYFFLTDQESNKVNSNAKFHDSTDFRMTNTMMEQLQQVYPDGTRLVNLPPIKQTSKELYTMYKKLVDSGVSKLEALLNVNEVSPEVADLISKEEDKKLQGEMIGTMDKQTGILEKSLQEMKERLKRVEPKPADEVKEDDRIKLADVLTTKKNLKTTPKKVKEAPEVDEFTKGIKEGSGKLKPTPRKNPSRKAKSKVLQELEEKKENETLVMTIDEEIELFDNLNTMNTEQLKARLRAFGLKVSGNKAVLIDRLLEYKQRDKTIAIPLSKRK